MDVVTAGVWLQDLQKDADGVSGQTGNNVCKDEQVIVNGGLLFFGELIFQILDAVKGSIGEDFMLTH